MKYENLSIEHEKNKTLYEGLCIDFDMLEKENQKLVSQKFKFEK